MQDEIKALKGIIPAYAGSTHQEIHSSRVDRDHPRIRGEHLYRQESPDNHQGSSPHTRGALVGTDPVDNIEGIIPAYAGSTVGHELTKQEVEDHPRIRGEHFAEHKNTTHGTGSSPHTRGAPFLTDYGLQDLGIIPAYAGSTLWSSGEEGGVWDHPRIRGEHQVNFKGALSLVGSSPHTRGAPQR